MSKLSQSNKKLIIRGTREGLWFEVAMVSDSDNIISGGELVATFEVNYSKEDKKFKLSKIKFAENLDKKTKIAIISEVKDFVESLNTS